jgi:protein-S-isoprenylcysteine O-methyltransferase Ste14
MHLDQDTPSIDISKPTWPMTRFGVVSRPSKKYLLKDGVLDFAERAIVLILFIYFANKMLPRFVHLIVTEIAHPELLWLAASTNLQAALLVVSESLAVFLILTRRFATTVSRRPLDWILSLMAVGAPLLVVPAAASAIVPSEIASVLMISGMIIQISAKAALWRSFGLIPANRGIKTKGPYHIVRHPMYAGYTLTHIGFLLGFPSLQNSLLYLVTFAIEIVRIFREELILNRDPLYGAYAARVRYRLFPSIF